MNDGINTAEYDPKSGKCVRHPNIRLRKKKLLGGWKILIGHCPECCLDEMRRVRDEISQADRVIVGNHNRNHHHRNRNREYEYNDEHDIEDHEEDYYDKDDNEDYDDDGGGGEDDEEEEDSRISGGRRGGDGGGGSSSRSGNRANGGRGGGGGGGEDESNNGDYTERPSSSSSSQRHRSSGGGGKKDKKKKRSGGGGERHKDRGERGGGGGGERRTSRGGGHHGDRERHRDRDRERDKDRDISRENRQPSSLPSPLPHYSQQQRIMVLSMAFTDQRTGQRGTYTGQVNSINRMPDGKGTVYYTNGSIAEGTWRNGMLVGSEEDDMDEGRGYVDSRSGGGGGGMMMRRDPPPIHGASSSSGGGGGGRRPHPHTVHHPANTTFGGGNLDQLDRLGGKPRHSQQRGTSSVHSYNSRGSVGGDMNHNNNVQFSGSASVQDYRGGYNAYSQPSVGGGGAGSGPYRRTDVSGYSRQYNPPGYR